MDYGSALRDLFLLDPQGRFLNHGSWGACPKSVFETQSRLRLERELAPDRFFEPTVLEVETNPLALAVESAARLMGATRETLAPVENATSAIQAVLNSTMFQPGDEILLSNHQYNAVKVAAALRCQQSGAGVRFVQIPPESDDDFIVQAYAAAVTSRTRLVILDHISSGTAMIFPVARICAALAGSGARILVDGAHAIGQIALDVAAIGCDYYTTNPHKWLYAPTGTGLVYSRDPDLKPAIVSHRAQEPFPVPFYYIGSRDYTAWLSLPAAVAFFDSMSPEGARAYAAELLAEADEMFAGMGVKPIRQNAPLMMRSYILPQTREADFTDTRQLKQHFWDKHRMQIFTTVWDGRLILRLSAAPYVDRSDLRVLFAELRETRWPVAV